MSRICRMRSAEPVTKGMGWAEGDQPSREAQGVEGRAHAYIYMFRATAVVVVKAEGLICPGGAEHT